MNLLIYWFINDQISLILLINYFFSALNYLVFENHIKSRLINQLFFIIIIDY